MTDYVKHAVLGSELASLVDSSKGDYKAAAMAEQAKNSGVALVKGAGVAAVAVGAYKAVENSPKTCKFLATPITKGAELIKGTKFGKYINGLPNKAKAAILLGVGAGLCLVSIAKERVFNAGKIDQKYTDKAMLKTVI